MISLKIIWTNEEVKFLRDNYIETTLTKEELRRLLNKKFKIKRTTNAINRGLVNNKIKKTDYYWRETSKKNVLKGIRKRSKEVKKFKLKAMRFMRKCSKKGRTFKQALLDSQIHFEMAMTISYFRIVAKEGNIKFVLPQTKEFINDLDPKMFNNKKLEEYIKSQSSKEREYFEIVSELIEFFEVKLTNKQIKKYCILKGINTKWK